MSELSNRIEKYGVMAAAAGAAAVGLGASATIVPSGPQNIVVDINDAAATAIDLDGDGANDVNFRVTTLGTANIPFVYVGASFNGDGPAYYPSSLGSFPYASNLAAGATIDSNLTFNTGYYAGSMSSIPVPGAATLIYSGFGAFSASPNGFIGYTFFAGNGVGQVFAWIELAGVSTTQLTVVQWGYEDAGTAIDAGDVPEPGSLALLALGAVGVMSRRSRKAVRDAA